MDVDEILSLHKQKYKTTEVHREIQPSIDLGNLLISDLSNIDTTRLKQEKEEYLLELARDNTQLLINEIWKLPIKRVEESIVVELPSATTTLPREKPIPKERPPTKWEEFAKQKGIMNRKRSRMVFDDKAQEYKPRWGYKRINDPKDKWIIEVPANADPYEDQFEKQSVDRKERISKNEYQRLQNIAKSQKGGRIKVSLPPGGSKKLNKHQITQALGMARKSTASSGVFTDKLPSEPTPKHSGKKTKYDQVAGKYSEEKSRAMDIMNKITNKKNILDTTKATNQFIKEEQTRNSKKNSGGIGGKKGEGGKGGRKKKGFNQKATPTPKKLMKQRAKKRK